MIHLINQAGTGLVVDMDEDLASTVFGHQLPGRAALLWRHTLKHTRRLRRMCIGQCLAQLLRIAIGQIA